MKTEDKIKKEFPKILCNIIFAALAIIIVILFHKNIILTTTLESIIGILFLIKKNSKLTLYIFILTGIWGALSEMLVIYTTQAWIYSIPSVLNLIPLWLFPLWANAGAFIYETAKELNKVGIKK